MICFHVFVNTVCSSFDNCFASPPPFAISFEIDLAILSLLSPTTSVIISETTLGLLGPSGWPGENAEADFWELDCGKGAGGGAKKVETKAYSAVALSMRTRSMDLKTASRGSFCKRFNGWSEERKGKN